jgi:hypothetical protein
MTVRAICTATLLFFDANDKSKPQVIAPMLQIVELPDWVTETTTYKVNLASGRIKVMNAGSETKAVEAVQENAQDLTARQQSETLEKEIAKMKKAELQEYCRTHDIEFKTDATNPELIALIKANI